ncbi:STAS domain-containing protein [Streptomyces sp. SM13]|uniref:STAS domain-containing protein n=1 Tax=Streptomyces sp. SM13 TaxID=1983803 RepID=UPI000CD5B9D5|nr:STAS domain-containing protein [Streptomyces sp. SM13]
MAIAERISDSVVILDVSGKLTKDEGAAVHAVVTTKLGEGASRFVVNLKQVNAVDSESADELIPLYTDVSDRGGKVALVRLGADDIAAASKLTTIFDVFVSEQGAIDAL